MASITRQDEYGKKANYKALSYRNIDNIHVTKGRGEPSYNNG